MGLVRFILALSIVFGHIPISNKLLLGAPMALHLFFMISGYSIFYVLETKYIKRKDGIKQFIKNRILRIYPLYLLILFGTILFALFETMNGYSNSVVLLFQQFSSHLGLIFASLVANIFIIGQDFAMFFSYVPELKQFFWTNNFIGEAFRLDRFLFVPQAWALALEIYFYCIAPKLIKLSSKWLFGLASLSLILRICLSINGFFFDPWMYRFFPTELFFFLLGALAFRYRGQLSLVYKKIPMQVFISIVVLSMMFFRSLPYIHYYDYQLFEWMFYPIFIFTMPYLFEKDRVWKWQIIMGSMSYPIYVTHLLVVAIMIHLHLSYPYYGIVALVGTLVTSYFLSILSSRIMRKHTLVH